MNMYCPQCGQQQPSEVIRYCSRCGFPLDGVIQLLHSGGLLPTLPPMAGENQISPRKRGVRQGGILMLTGVLLVPILGVINSYSGAVFLDFLVAVAAIVCFLGGPLRMIYAALFEEGAPKYLPTAVYGPPPAIRPGVPPRGISSLPPAPNSTASWRSRPNTAELVPPPSITENTTRLLEKDESRER